MPTHVDCERVRGCVLAARAGVGPSARAGARDAGVVPAPKAVIYPGDIIGDDMLAEAPLGATAPLAARTLSRDRS